MSRWESWLSFLHKGEQVWPTIVSCKAYRCTWNKFDIKTKVGTCGKLMIQLNGEGKCVELAKYVVNNTIEPGIYQLETDVSEMAPDQIEATKNLKPGTHL